MSSSRVETSFWPLHKKALLAPKSIDNVNCVLALNLNKEECFRTGATSFNDWKDVRTKGCYSILFQLFIRLGEKLSKLVTNMDGDKDAIEKSKLVTFWMESCIRDEKTQLRDEIGSNPLRGALNITDYTFYIVVSNSEHFATIDVEAQWGELIEGEINKYHEDLRKVDTRKSKERKPISVTQQFLHATNLPSLYDLYRRKPIAAIYSDVVSSVSAKKENYILSANAMFSPLNAFCARDPNVIYEQSVRNIENIFTIGKDGVSSFRFPCKKYTMSISSTSWSIEHLFDRTFPETQLKKMIEDQALISIAVKQHLNQNVLRSGLRNNRDIDPDNEIPNTDEETVDLAKQMMGMDITKANIGMPDKPDNEDNLYLELAKKFGLEHFYKTSGRTDEYGVNDFINDMGYEHRSRFSAVSNDSEYVSAYSETLEMSKKLRATLSQFEKILNTNETLYGHKIRDKKVVMRKLSIMANIATSTKFFIHCMSPDGDFSPYERAVLKGIIDEKLFETKYEVTKLQKEISPFGSYLIKTYLVLDKLHMILDKHELAQRIWFAALDAYRNEFELHINIVLVSKEGGVGKSYQFDVVERRKIRGTTQLETKRSEKAGFDDQTNKNGATVIMHELDRSFIEESNSSNGKTGSDKERTWKEMLTQMKFTTCRLVQRMKRDGSGEKEWVTNSTNTSAIGVFLMATNSDIYRIMSKAMNSRLQLIYCDETKQQTERTTFAMKMAETLLGTEGLNEKNESIRHDRTIEALYYLVERLIWVGAITAPSLHVPMAVLMALEQALKKEKISGCNNRSLYRIVILARTICIVDAIIKTFFIKGAKYYGKVIKPEYLLSLDPKLFVQMEHVVCALGMQKDQFGGDGIDLIVRNALLAITMDKGSYTECKQSNIPINGVGKHVYDYNWIEIKVDASGNPFEKLVEKISHKINGSSVFGKKVSGDQVYAVLKKYTENSFLLNAYTNKYQEKDYYVLTGKVELQAKPGSTDGNAVPAKAASNAPVIPKPVPKPTHMSDLMSDVTKKAKQSKNANPTTPLVAGFSKTHIFADVEILEGEQFESQMISEKRAGRVCVHRDLFYKDSPNTVNVIKNVILGMLSKKHQLPRKMIFDTHETYTYIANFIETYGPTSDDILSIPNLLEMDNFAKEIVGNVDGSISQNVTTEIIPITTDIDTWGMECRFKLLYITEKKINPTVFSKKILGFDITKNVDSEGNVKNWISDDTFGPSDPTNPYSTKSNGYLLGREMTELRKQKEGQYSIEDIAQYIEDLDYDPLIDSSSDADDMDFEPEDYFICEVDGKRIYHWDLFPPKCGITKNNYKMVCHHPFYVNHFFNEKAGNIEETSKVYPRDYIKEHEKRNKDRWSLCENLKTDSDLFKGLVSRGATPGYELVGGKVIRVKSYSTATDYLMHDELAMFRSTVMNGKRKTPPHKKSTSIGLITESSMEPPNSSDGDNMFSRKRKKIDEVNEMEYNNEEYDEESHQESDEMEEEEEEIEIEETNEVSDGEEQLIRKDKFKSMFENLFRK